MTFLRSSDCFGGAAAASARGRNTVTVVLLVPSMPLRIAVDKYVADPLCGFVCRFGFYRDFLSGFASVYRRGSAFSGLPKALPLYILAGAEDPLGGAVGFVPILAGKYKAAGLQDVSTRLYPGARHEILNETNRDEVMADIKDWLETELGKPL